MDAQRRRVVRVNGTERELAATDLSELLAQLGHPGDAKGIAVAVNGQVVPRSTWSEKKLQTGDDVEIVGAVQGG
jgi:sulfur carrier protein